ncbi:MAG TPA: NUDIX domain-containing protein [Candidatus Saccharimonadia bacterium]|nr:NUDIX domain-containing protein [Candidatus Saccharimonadia bacterium]
MTPHTYPPVITVDEHDNEIGSAMLSEVWEKGLYHRIASVFIIDEQGKMLLQHRGPNVKAYPNSWDQAAGGHVDAGQTYESTAITEAAEELGLHNLVLTTLGTYRSNHQEGKQIINQFERVFSALIPSDTMLQPEAAELSDLQWFTSVELKALIGAQSEKFTPGLLYDLEHYFPDFAPTNKTKR